MRPLPLLALAATAACAAPYAPPAVSGALHATTVRVPEAGTFRTATALDYALEGTDPRAVWNLLPEAFESLGIPYSVMDDGSRTIGSPGTRVARIRSARPGRYLDCGSDMTGQYANLYPVYLAVLTSVEEPEEGRVALRTLLEATVRDPAHGNAPVRCTTRGLLEQEIAAFLEGRLAAASRQEAGAR